MKYIEELTPGDVFELDQKNYLLSSDFKSNGNRSCINISTGQFQWFAGNTIVQICPIYKLDKENNIIPIKPTEKTNV